jgi:hypothetical protein
MKKRDLSMEQMADKIKPIENEINFLNTRNTCNPDPLI